MWITPLAFEAGDFQGGIDPLVDEGAEPLVGGDLAMDLGKVLFADEVRAALALPGVAELVVGPVFLGRVRLTAAGGIAADVVLLRERTRTQGAKSGDFALDGIDAA